MIIKNGTVFHADHHFAPADIAVEGHLISKIASPGSLDGEVIDAQGCYVVPGFVDIHIHGSAGSDFCDGTRADFLKIAAYLGSQGVTSFCGTSMAIEESSLYEVFAAAGAFIGEENSGCAVMRGVNMEGPFFSKQKKGAQCEDHLAAPDIDLFHKLNELSGYHIVLSDIAPELGGADAFIREVSRHANVSLAHTTATYDQAAAAFAAGASHVTHLFNAMPPFHHRDPGVIGAASDYASYVEVISDGIHLHPSVVRAVYQWFGAERICLISDAMRACGMQDGEYSLGGQYVKVVDGKANLADGTIAGSATSLAECFRRAVAFGVPLESALVAATENPAKATGLFELIGSIAEGKRADILILNQDLSLNRTIIGGK